MNLYVEHTLSTKIYNRAQNKDSEEVVVDPATLILIGKISVTIIRLIKSCKDSNEERTAAVKYPTTNENKILKKIVRRELGWLKYVIMGRRIVKAIKEVGTDLTYGELEAAELYRNNDSFTIYNGEKYYEL
jgi:hypothetical protein